MNEAIERLNKAIEEGTLIRNAWTGTDEQGRHTACLLAAMVPECGECRSSGACPAEVMPAWLATLTPWIDDAGSAEAWPAMVRRYAAVAARWHVLSSADWLRVEYAVRALIVREAIRHTTEPAALAACERVAVLCEGVASGGAVDDEAFRSARVAAAEAAGAAAAEADRIIDATLGVLEAACSKAERLEEQVLYWGTKNPSKAQAFDEALFRLNSIRHGWPGLKQ